MKKILLIFEGADGSGKSTLKKEFNKISGYRYIIIERAFLSNYAFCLMRKDKVYHPIYNPCPRHLKKDNPDVYLDFAKSISSVVPTIFIFFYCNNKKILLKRLKDKQSDKYEIFWVLKSLKYFRKAFQIFKRWSINIIKINTNTSMSRVIKRLKEKIVEIDV